MARPATGTQKVTSTGEVVIRISLRGGVKISVNTLRPEGDTSIPQLQTHLTRYARELFAGGTMQREALAAALSKMVAQTRGVAADKLPGTWARIRERDLAKPEIAAAAAATGVAQFVEGKVYGDPTVRQVIDWWLSGEISKWHPKVTVQKRTAAIRRDMELYVLPEVGDLLVKYIEVEHFNKVYNSPLAAHLAKSSRGLTWRRFTQVMSLCEYPLKVIPIRPNSAAAKPAEDERESACLEPRDDLHLGGCQTISVHDRVFFAFLAREGVRVSEARDMSWSDIQAVNGVALGAAYSRKTGKRLRWALNEGVYPALMRYRERFRPGEPDSAKVFKTTFPATDEAEAFRRFLWHAGVTRDELFDHDPARQQYRVTAHGCRGLFVTWALATGKPDSYIRARTEHSDTETLEGYRTRADILIATLQLTFAPMDQLIPELREVGVPPVTIRPIRVAKHLVTRNPKKLPKRSRAQAPAAAPAPVSIPRHLKLVETRLDTREGWTPISPQ